MPVATLAIIKDIVIPCIAVLVGSIGATITIYIYHRNLIHPLIFRRRSFATEGTNFV